MPTPNVYADRGWNPFEDVPAALQGDTVSVLYVTDRAPEPPDADGTEAAAGPTYGAGRSRSMAFGEAVVQIGTGLGWDDIVALSRTGKRGTNPELTVASAREIARFGKTPPSLVLTDAQMAALAQHKTPPPDPATVDAAQRFCAELSARLAQTPRKEVFIYVHGFANTFDDAVMTTGEIWHFLGREGVPVCYTWPADSGLFQAYEYTVASTDFTIFHLKQAIRLIASCPDVERINILAHSRGTAVVTDAVRELHIELRSTTDTQRALKLGSVLLAAADIDLDVAIARNGTERIGQAVERSALYISHQDKALGLSTWLFGGAGRVGDVDAKIFSKEELETLRHSSRLQLIEARVHEAGTFGHSYYHANPAVSSDLVLFLRYRLLPGAAHGRPLAVTEGGLWEIEDGYPGADWSPSCLGQAK